MTAATGVFGFAQLFRLRGSSPLYALVRGNAQLLPFVIALGLVAAVFEALGIGILIPLLSLFLGQAVPASTPAPIRAIAEFGNAWQPGARLALFCGLIVALFMAKALVQLATLAVQARMLERITTAIRNALARKLLRVDYCFIIGEDSGRFINILYQDMWNLTAWMRSVLSLMVSGCALLVTAALLFWVDWRLTVLVCAFGALVMLAFPVFERRLRHLSATAKRVGVLLDGRLETVLYSQRTVRLFRQEGREAAQFERVSDEYRRVAERAFVLRLSALPAIELGVALLSVAIILVGYRLGLSISSLAAYLVLLSRGQPQLRALGDARLSTAAIAASAREANWLLSVEEPAASRVQEGTPACDASQAIRFEKVSYHYPNGGRGVHDLTFSLRPGVATALVGASGAGKSTVVNLLTRLFEPQAGSILLGDRPIPEVAISDWRSRVAVAGQDLDLVDASIADNIAYGRPDASAEEIEAAARVADAHGFIAALPHGYATRVGRSGISLSGGQRQRIALARALLMRPELLILDEATNAVDGVSEKAFMDLLIGHSHFKTALVISHRESAIAICEDAIVMAEGRVIESGPLRSLRSVKAAAE